MAILSLFRGFLSVFSSNLLLMSVKLKALSNLNYLKIELRIKILVFKD